MINIPVGLQTYSVRDFLDENYLKSLQKIADIGYDCIEIGGFGPYTTSEWKNVLSETGLSIVANHIQIEMLEESFNHIIEFNRAISNHRIVCPYLREERRQDLEGYKAVAKVLNKIGKKCKEQEFDFFYHNHAFEFTDYNGKCGYDILINETDPNYVQFEIDTCWVKFAGRDPVETLVSLAGRCDIIHLKDLEDGKKIVFKEIGAGILDFNKIISKARDIGVKCLIVEQDVCMRNAFDCVADSYNEIKKISENLH